jgi:hypothetical protein
MTDESVDCVSYSARFDCDPRAGSDKHELGHQDGRDQGREFGRQDQGDHHPRQRQAPCQPSRDLQLPVEVRAQDRAQDNSQEDHHDDHDQELMQLRFRAALRLGLTRFRVPHGNHDLGERNC